MTPPISIDGTDITGATIDGTDVQEITVDGDVVFSAGPSYPPGTVDNFQSGNLNNYNGELNEFNITSTNPIDGSFSLNGSVDVNYIYSKSGLPNYPQAGDSFSFKMRVEGTVNIFCGMVFGVQANEDENYSVFMSSDGDDVRLRKNVGQVSFGSGLGGFNNSQNYNNDVFRFEVDWGTNGTITVTVHNETTSTQIGSGSVNDSSYTSGGIGWTASRFTGSITDPSRIIYDQAVLL